MKINSSMNSSVYDIDSVSQISTNLSLIFISVSLGKLTIIHFDCIDSLIFIESLHTNTNLQFF